LYCEVVANLTWSGGVHAYVADEAVHGATSGATGTVGSNTTAWAATGYMVLNDPVGKWTIGEDIHDSAHNKIAVVALLGYSVKDNSNASGAPYGVNITPTNRITGWPLIDIGGIGAIVSKIDCLKYMFAGRITTNQSIPITAETDVVFNQCSNLARINFDAATGYATVKIVGKYAIAVNITIVTTAVIDKKYYLRVYKGKVNPETGAYSGSVIGLTQQQASSAIIENFKLQYRGLHNISAGDVIKVTLSHNDTDPREILKDSIYEVEYTSFSIEGL